MQCIRHENPAASISQSTAPTESSLLLTSPSTTSLSDCGHHDHNHDHHHQHLHNEEVSQHTNAHLGKGANSANSEDGVDTELKDKSDKNDDNDKQERFNLWEFKKKKLKETYQRIKNFFT